jgi:hypothetical protein
MIFKADDFILLVRKENDQRYLVESKRALCKLNCINKPQ